MVGRQKEGVGMSQSSWEDMLANQITEAGLPPPTREYKFLKSRRFRWDFCWINEKFAVEVQGGIFSRGGHVTGVGYTKDRVKMNLATLDGWRFLEVTTAQVGGSEAITWIREYFDKFVEKKDV
jgi:hypothetical protein